MDLSECRIGFAITGSFCTYDKIKGEIKKLAATKAAITPIFSYNGQQGKNRFVDTKEYIKEIEEITGHKAILTIEGAEPIGPKKLFDIIVIAPCTGNTMAKLCNGITDTPVLMAAKAHLRNNRPLVVSVSSNDSLSTNLKNIGMLVNSKNIYLVPFGQDDYVKKPNSMVAHVELIPETIQMALIEEQIQPIVRSPFAEG